MQQELVWNGLIGLAAYPVKRSLEKMFNDGTDDFYEQLQKSKNTESKNQELRQMLSCNSSGQQPLNGLTKQDLANLIHAQEQKSCLGCVPWGNTYSCNQLEELKKNKLINKQNI